MPNPQKNQDRLGYILIAVAFAILLFFYGDLVEASDAQVQCFSDQEIERIEADIQSDMQMVGEKARISGMEEAYTKIVKTLHAECSAGKGYVTFPHSQVGTIVMTCPAK